MASGIEPGVVFALTEEAAKASPSTSDSVSLRSIAISLKRIADALYGNDQNTGIIRMIGEIADRAYHGQGPTS